MRRRELALDCTQFITRAVVKKMKRSDIDTLNADGLITAQQHAAIIERYALDAHGARIGSIFALIGAAICMAGVALVISANWAEIPRLVKVAAAVLLLIALHVGGVYANSKSFQRISAALHVAGSVMFLLSIALIGQAYNLSSRPPNAILLWMLGIAALPWLLASRAQFFLLVGALVAWLGMESEAVDSWLYLRDVGLFAPVLLTWIGATLVAVSAALTTANGLSRALRFDSSAETVGTVMLSLGLLVCVSGYNAVGIGRLGKTLTDWASYLPFWISLVAVSTVVVFAMLDRRSAWGPRVAWASVICAAVVLPWWIALSPYAAEADRWQFNHPATWVASAVLLLFALAQIQRGVMRSSRATVNIGISFVALNIAVVYIRLFGNMMNTGITFVVTGALLVLLAWFLERWRRRLTINMAARNTKVEVHDE